MNINYELYRIFYVVATTGNITKASQELMISQPAVTKQIKTLESQLGGELFIRTKKGVHLTENGQAIYKYVKQGINCFNNAELVFSNLKQLETGTVKIGISTTLARLFLLPYLEKFHQQYPKITIHLFTDPSKKMREMLKTGDIDILIAKENRYEDDELKITRLGILHNCIVASNAFPELKNKTISLKDLNNYPILIQRPPSTSRDTFDHFCQENNIQLTSAIEIASSSLLEDFVKIGLGVGLVTKEFAESEIKTNHIFEVKTQFKLPTVYYSLFTLKDSYHSFGANKLIEIITNKTN